MLRAFNTLPGYGVGIICCWQLLLLGGSIWILIVGTHEKRRINPLFRNIFFVLLCGINYLLFQATSSCISDSIDYDITIRFVEVFGRIPVYVILAVCLFLTVVEESILLLLKHWYNTHITLDSLREIVETLPVGICVYEMSGKIILKNRTMEQICRRFSQTALLNGNEFMQLLQNKKSDFADYVVELQNYGIWSITSEQLQDEDNHLSMLIAYNVTEAYEKTRMLQEKQQTMQELNTKLQEYNIRIQSVITAQEILNAKIRIHDELGEGLLAIRHYLTFGGTDKERAEMLERLRKNVQFLQQESMTDAQDEYELIITTAQKLGVAVQVEGLLPEIEPYKHIVATAIHECITNILRHTNGDTLFIAFTEIGDKLIFEFEDNNSRPIEQIAEKGGLCSLRMLVEQVKGEMQVSVDSKYKLTITLPKEFEKYGR